MTRRQRQVYGYVADRIAETGLGPSTAEIAEHIGVCRGRAGEIVAELARKGLLRRAGRGRATRLLEVVPLEGKGLRADEIAWCHANPERVRAMMLLVNAPVRAMPAPPPSAHRGPTLHEAVAAGRRALDHLWPGDAADIELPMDPDERKRAYRSLSMVATRRWGPGGASRHLSRTGVRVVCLHPDVSAD